MPAAPPPPRTNVARMRAGYTGLADRRRHGDGTGVGRTPPAPVPAAVLQSGPMHDDDVDEAFPVDHRFRCPGCDEDVDVSPDTVGQLVRCPYCNTEFFAADGQTHAEVIDDTPAAPDDAPPPDELDAARVRQLSALRLATLRTRSWWLIGLLLAALTGFDLLAKAVVFVWDRHAWGVRPTLLTLAGGAALWAATAARRAAAQLTREVNASALPEPTTPPDFSTLDNGADRWQRLHEVR